MKDEAGTAAPDAATTDDSGELLSTDEQRRVLSSSRLKVALATFVTTLVLALGVLTVLLISHIFGMLNPTIRQDLAWKAERGATEVAASADLAILVADQVLVRQTFERFRTDADIVAIVVTDVDGKTIARQGATAVPLARLLAGPPNATATGQGVLFSWASAVVEGKPVGRAAVVVSTQRLEAGKRLEQRIIFAVAVGGLASLLLSLFFTRYYIGPILHVTERAFDRLRDAAIAMLAKQRLERELELGARIQTSILPAAVSVPGLELAARMIPATEVGGDYYDVHLADDGCWIGIGDVAGHGLTSGLIMLMTQSAVSALVVSGGLASPRDVVCGANRLLYDNIRNRLGKNEFVTFSLLRYFRDGRVTFAGAHEPMIVYRAGERRCEVVDTAGTWLGATEDISTFTVDDHLQLRDGDLLFLHTDGLSEAMNEAGESFGLSRLVAAVERGGDLTPDALLEAIFGEIRTWMRTQDDDMTALAVRYRAGAGS